MVKKEGAVFNKELKEEAVFHKELRREQELIAATVSDYLAAEVRLRCMMQSRVGGWAGGAG